MGLAAFLCLITRHPDAAGLVTQSSPCEMDVSHLLIRVHINAQKQSLNVGLGSMVLQGWKENGTPCSSGQSESALFFCSLSRLVSWAILCSAPVHKLLNTLFPQIRLLCRSCRVHVNGSLSVEYFCLLFSIWCINLSMMPFYLNIFCYTCASGMSLRIKKKSFGLQS